MPNFSPIPLQQAVYSSLSADSALNALITGIFDHVPQATNYPYIIFSNVAVADWSTKTNLGTQQTLTLSVWSREGGRLQAATIMERVAALLHNAALTLSGESLVSLRFSGSDSLLQDDGVTYRADMRFIAYTQL